MRSQSYAPFGSISIRIKKDRKKENQVQAPGPGSYDISLPFIHPIVQTIRKKNNNVIVKLGHIGTASFQSDQERFDNQNPTEVGPGKYSPEAYANNKLKNSRHRSVAVEQVKRLMNNKLENRATISEVRELEINDYVEMPSLAKKKLEVKALEKVKGSIWSKFTEDRQIKVRSVSNIGPGEYNPKQINSKEVPSSAFKSQSIRSFFDKIYFETNQDKLAKEREQKKYKLGGVGPGNYNINEENGNKFYKYQFFGSTEERHLA